MKKLLFFLILIPNLYMLSAQTDKPDLYQFKTSFIYGRILKHTKHLENIVKGPAMGFEFDYELFTLREDKPWHQYFNHPKIGVGTVFLNLGNDEILGNLIALYPYLNFSLIKADRFNLFLKGGAGASYLTKTFQDTKYYDEQGTLILGKSNAAIGSHINVYFALGGNVEYRLSHAFSLMGDFTWNHASNGSFFTPNSGLNILNSSLGLVYFPVYKQQYSPQHRDFENPDSKTGMDIIFSGGVRQLDYRDNISFPTGSFVVSVHRNVSKQVRLGLGLDAFYDGAYASVNSSADPAVNISKSKFTYLTSDLMLNRFRAGISLQPELLFGRMVCGLHFGLYLFNPIKNLEPYEDAKSDILNKPLIYPYDIEKENGWLYTRASFKYLINKHLFINLGLKTHLHKAEFIEWGLGYRL